MDDLERQIGMFLAWMRDERRSTEASVATYERTLRELHGFLIGCRRR